MAQETMQAMMPPAEMIEMFTLKMVSNQSIEKIAQHVPAECEKKQVRFITNFQLS